MKEVEHPISLHAEAVHCIPVELSLDSIIFAQCPECGFSDSIKTLLRSQVASFLRSCENASSVSTIKCHHCAVLTAKPVDMLYSYMVIFVIQSVCGSSILVRLSSLNASKVLGYSPQEALKSKEVGQQVMEVLNGICPAPNFTGTISEDNILNWVIKSSDSNGSRCFSVIAITNVCHSQRYAFDNRVESRDVGVGCNLSGYSLNVSSP